MLKVCPACGELSEETWCEEHRPKPNPRLDKNRDRGYDYKWKKLSRLARRLQPFCLDCGSRENLTADHKPEAWRRKAKGLPIRLEDIDVVCMGCNIKRGAARRTDMNRSD